MKSIYTIVICFIYALFCNLSFGQTNDKDIALSAERFYKAGNYTEALPLYAQLLSNHKDDAKYAYFYGVCRYMRGVNVADAIGHLEKAAASPSVPSDVNYYIGRCYHLTYQFSDAVTYYEKFKKTASTQQLQSLEIDLNIQMCRNAINLPDKSDKYLINDKKIVDENQLLQYYQLDPLRDGKILTMTDDYKSNSDKKLKEKQYLYLDPTSTKLYYSSRGIDGEGSSDIMLSVKKISRWDKPSKLTEANSKYDEIHPTSSKDGKIIYFSAKSPQSMGGYDIFKMEYNAEAGAYGNPENLGAPINSPFDDYLYAYSNIERTHYITSTRDCEKGRVCVIKFDENEPTEGYINIKGKFFNFDRPNEFNVNITFLNQQNWKNLGETRVDSKTGEYNIKLPAVARYGCKIDVMGYSLLVGDFVLLPDKKIVNQEIIINKQNNGQERLTIKNTYPEDVKSLITSANLTEKNTTTKSPISKKSLSKEGATSKNAINPVAKNQIIAKISPVSNKLIPNRITALEAKRTVNWKVEKFDHVNSLKPKEDKELIAWAKSEQNSNIVQPPVKDEKPVFNLENISLADLESQNPKKKNTEPGNTTLATTPITKSKEAITALQSMPLESIPLVNNELAINNNSKRESKSNFISELPPIGYEILDDSDRSKKEIIVAPLASNENVNDTQKREKERKNLTPIGPISKVELASLPVSKNDLALKMTEEQKTGSLNYIASLPVNDHSMQESISSVAPIQYSPTIQPGPDLALLPAPKTGKTNYITTLPDDLKEEPTKADSVHPAMANNQTFSEARIRLAVATISPKQVARLKEVERKHVLAPMSRTGKVKVILPAEVTEENENMVNNNSANGFSNPVVTSKQSSGVEIATVELSAPLPREENVASLRYKFRAFENKSESQVRGIVKQLNGGGQ